LWPQTASGATGRSGALERARLGPDVWALGQIPVWNLNRAEFAAQRVMTEDGSAVAHRDLEGHGVDVRAARQQLVGAKPQPVAAGLLIKSELICMSGTSNRLPISGADGGKVAANGTQDFKPVCGTWSRRAEVVFSSAASFGAMPQRSHHAGQHTGALWIIGLAPRVPGWKG
jgi:hypothetical protein